MRNDEQMRWFIYEGTLQTRGRLYCSCPDRELAQTILHGLDRMRVAAFALDNRLEGAYGAMISPGLPQHPSPRVGDIVHYRVAHDPGDWECIAGTCRAAIVTSVNPANPEIVSLRVFTVAGEFVEASVQRDDCPKSWHWPEGVGTND